METTFQFDQMTPELQACLDHWELRDAIAREAYAPVSLAWTAWEEAGRPEQGPLKEAERTAQQAHQKALQNHRAVGQQLQDRIQPGLLEAYREAHKVWYCRDGSIVGGPEEFSSPSGRYRLVVTGHGTTPSCWNYSKGRVYEGDKLIQTVYRNYGSFPFLFVEGHPKGYDLLLCGEDYQGQTMIELDTGRRVNHLPEAASEGAGFCWSHFTVSPSKRTLAVSGCYWACSYEVWFLDLTDPFDFPLPVLKRDADAESLFEWDQNQPDTCSVGRSFEVYLPLGKPEHDLTAEELEEADRREAAGEKVWGSGRETRSWTRPSDTEAAREYTQSLIDGWLAHGDSLPKEYREMAQKLVARLPESDRVGLLEKLGTA